MLIDFTTRCIRVDPSDRPGMVILRAASSHDVNAQLLKGTDNEAPRLDGGVVASDFWEAERVGLLRRFYEWQLAQGLFDDESHTGEGYSFVLESAYVTDEDDVDAFGHTVGITVTPVTNKGWAVEIAEHSAGERDGMAISILVDDLDAEGPVTPSTKPEPENHGTFYDRLME